MRRLVPLAAVLALGGCAVNTTSKDGRVGETLTAGGLRATVIKFANEVPRKEGRDYSGLGTPTTGERFFGVDTKVCNDRGKAIGPYDFKLELEGGGHGRLRFPQTVYSDDFESVRDGCERGWIVFAAPKASSASAVTFKYDDTGSARPGGSDTERHARFKWKL